MLPPKTRQALNFWTDCYKAGVRFTIEDGKAMPERCLCYADRIDSEIGFGRFGEFMDWMPVEPEPWMVDGVLANQEGLAALLLQNPPKPYDKFFYHLLCKDYECDPIREHAARSGIDIGWVSVDGGCFLMYNGKWKNKIDEKKDIWEIGVSKGWKTPLMPPILNGIGKIEI